MKFLYLVVVVCAITSDLISATYYQGGSTYRVRRQGVKGGQSGQYQQFQQEKTYSGGAALAGAQRPAVRPLPSRPRAPARQQIQYEEGQYDQENQIGGGEANAEPPVYGGVQGTPGKDFPAYGQIPATSFSCGNVPYEPGMYADEETQCQAYHVCFQGRKESFLCGVGTVFNQAILACDYWHSVECGRTKEFYSVNEELGKPGAEPSQGGQQQGGSQAFINQAQAQAKYRQPQPQPARQQYQQPRPQPAKQYKPRPQYDGQSTAYGGAQAQAQAQAQYAPAQPQYQQPRPQAQPQYPRKSVRPVQPIQPAAEYEEVETTYEEAQQPQYQPQTQPQYQPKPQSPGRKSLPRPQAPQYQQPRPQYQPQPQAPKPQRTQTTSVKAQVQYGGNQVNTQVDQVSVDAQSGGVEYAAEEDQAAVRAPQLVAPSPRAQYQPAKAASAPRPQLPLVIAPAPQQATAVKSKYRAGGAVAANQSPSYRSKALAQAQVRPQEEEPQEQPVEYVAQPQFNEQVDTQQKLNY